MKSKTRIYLLFGSVVFFVLFLLFSIVVKNRLVTNFDFDASVKLQNHISRSFDLPFSYFSLLGSFEVTTSLTVFIFMFFLFKKRKLWLSLSAFFVAIGIEVLGKIFIPHPSPPFFLLRYNLGVIFPSFYVRTGSSFPSGHMTRTAFLIILLIFIVLNSRVIKPKKYIWILSLVTVGILMFISRIYLGEHWFSDVLGGLFLGTSFGFISLVFW